MFLGHGRVPLFLDGSPYAGSHPVNTIIFAVGENANESHLSHHNRLAKITKTWFNIIYRAGRGVLYEQYIPQHVQQTGKDQDIRPYPLLALGFCASSHVFTLRWAGNLGAMGNQCLAGYRLSCTQRPHHVVSHGQLSER